MALHTDLLAEAQTTIPLSYDLVWVFGIIAIVIIVVGFVSVLRSNTHTTGSKVLWCIGFLIVPILAALVWFLWGKDQGTIPDQESHAQSY